MWEGVRGMKYHCGIWRLKDGWGWFWATCCSRGARSLTPSLFLIPTSSSIPSRALKCYLFPQTVDWDWKERCRRFKPPPSPVLKRRWVELNSALFSVFLFFCFFSNSTPIKRTAGVIIDDGVPYRTRQSRHKPLQSLSCTVKLL
jgi:hypothetical protein